MRGLGFIVAIASGVAAVVLHMIALSAIKTQAKIPATGYAAVQHDYEVGDILGEPNGDKKKKATELFFKIDVPDSAKLPGVKISEIGAAIDKRLTRPLKKGELVLQQDIGPSLPKFLLREDEHVMFVSLDGIAVETSLIKVGANIGFVVEVDSPSDATELPEGEINNGSTLNSTLNEIGPFRVVSIGEAVAADAADKSNVVGVAFIADANGQLAESQSMLLDAQRNRTLHAVTIFPDSIPSEASDSE